MDLKLVRTEDISLNGIPVPCWHDVREDGTVERWVENESLALAIRSSLKSITAPSLLHCRRARRGGIRPPSLIRADSSLYAYLTRTATKFARGARLTLFGHPYPCKRKRELEERSDYKRELLKREKRKRAEMGKQAHESDPASSNGDSEAPVEEGSEKEKAEDDLHTDLFSDDGGSDTAPDDDGGADEEKDDPMETPPERTAIPVPSSSEEAAVPDRPERRREAGRECELPPKKRRALSPSTACSERDRELCMALAESADAVHDRAAELIMRCGALSEEVRLLRSERTPLVEAAGMARAIWALMQQAPASLLERLGFN